MVVLLTDELLRAAVLESSMNIIDGDVARTPETFFHRGKTCSNKPNFMMMGLIPASSFVSSLQ